MNNKLKDLLHPETKFMPVENKEKIVNSLLNCYSKVRNEPGVSNTLHSKILRDNKKDTRPLNARGDFENPPSGNEAATHEIPFSIISNPKQLGAHFAAAREAAGLTQEQVATITGGKTRAPAIRRFEAGTGNPSLSTIVEYCSAVGLKLGVSG